MEKDCTLSKKNTSRGRGTRKSGRGTFRVVPREKGTHEGCPGGGIIKLEVSVPRWELNCLRVMKKRARMNKRRSKKRGRVVVTTKKWQSGRQTRTKGGG